MRVCERWRSLASRNVPDESILWRNACLMRARWRGPTARDVATFHVRSTLVADLFACCPPGPPEGLKETWISSPGIDSDRVTRMSPPTQAIWRARSAGSVTGRLQVPLRQT